MQNQNLHVDDGVPMKKFVFLLAIFTWLALSCGLVSAATYTLTVQADSTIAGNPGKVMHEVFVETGEPDATGDFLLFQEAAKYRIYAFSDDGGPWEVLPAGSYFVPVSSMTIGETWSWLPDDLGGSTTATVDAIESVTVPAGTYANSYRVDIRSDSAGPGSQPLESYWFVSGVGFVYNEVFFEDGSLDFTQKMLSFTGSGTGFFPGNVGNTWVYDEQPVGPVAGVADQDLPISAVLAGAYPNPFNPSTKLVFEMGAPGPVSLRIYDPAGRLVKTLVDEHRDIGRHEVVWNGRDDAGRLSSAGVYLYRFESGEYSETKRMTLVK
jgi:hypothetical protein